MSLADVIETLFLGCVGTVILSGVFGLLYTFFRYPMVFGGTILVALFIYGLGWCMRHWDDFYDLLFTPASRTKSHNLPSCGIPTLDRLRDLEMKYKISTTQFLSFVHNNVMPVGIDNLDYLEWVSLVNDLPLLNKEIGE